MNAKSPRRPSAALVLACIALFVALGGGAYAVSKASINGKKIKKGTITSKQIKDKSVAGKDLQDDTVTGTQIKEDSLGQVPSAGDSAKLAGVEGVRVQPFTLTNGQSQQILQRGAFTLTATCSINEAGTDFARVLISTTVDNAAFDGADSATDLDIGTPATNREFADASNTTGSPTIDQESDGMAIAPDGSEILGTEAFAAVNLPQDGVGVCKFGGLYFVD